MPSAKRGEVWLVDLGYLGKTRPCLVISVPTEGLDRVLCTIVPHTTTVRGSRFEIQVAKKFLKSGAFSVQGLATVKQQKVLRKLGELNAAEMKLEEDGVIRWLGLV